ncbi:lipopolysaccharide biosynthesis protein [Clostridium putrefaciens]|uniref:Lipopolysaccharide biosynthesis protein n=1 Tax=Clostridium putrefaciens TaxID=99675 RepID=A0A381J722_9CLOT|nr:Gfo/Idh/MocA family oxidoreductase [Clostridium putrefaciens]SUY45816.1 lipopolysaccharide biosynthesis protein [Clostridium putrefaciens]
MLKFAIIGCGRISHKHIEALINNNKEAVLVSVCDIIEDKAIELKKQYEDVLKESDVRVYTDYIKMLENEEIDVVAISTESGYHAKHAMDCLNKDKHVLIEKPMALSVEDADRIIALGKEKNKKVCISHQNRFNPPIQKLRRAMEEGRFGKIINGTARILWTRDDNYYKQAPWRGTKALDGGTLMNQCIHNIDLLQWMMGSEVERIHAERDTYLRNIEMEDFGAILIRFKNGSIGMVEGSACVYPKNLEETLSIFGEKGTVVIGGLAVNEIKTWQFEDERDYDKEDESSEVDSVYGKGHTPLYKDLIDSINNNREPLVSGEEGKKAMQIILKAYEQ